MGVLSVPSPVRYVLHGVIIGRNPAAWRARRGPAALARTIKTARLDICCSTNIKASDFLPRPG